MSFSGLTNQIRSSSQRSSRQGARISLIILHGQASTSDDSTINSMVSGSKQVSANYTVSNEGRLTGIVDEEDRAWTSGSSTDGGKGAAADRRAITVEVENSTGGPGWCFSAAAQKTVARLVADVSRRYSIPLVRITGVIGHRELWTVYRASYPTACPQSLDMDWITNDARAQLGQGTAPAPIPGNSQPASSSPTDYGFGLTGAAQLATQKALARLGRYTGDQDGQFGAQSVSAFQQWLKDSGLLTADYKVDGEPGEVYGLAIQTLAKRYGYTGDMDGQPGEDTSAAVQRWAASIAPSVPQVIVAPAGRGWSYWEPNGELCKRVQRALIKMHRLPANYEVDGIAGELFRKAVQTTLNVSGRFVGTVDGVIERGGCFGIQQYAHDFGSYTGDIDGAPREASWAGFALGLERG